MHVAARRRVPSPGDSAGVRVTTEQLELAPARTAAVLCDMWNEHWCRGATRRVAQMAPRMNEVIEELRRKGVLIIHAPSSTMSFYADAPGRALARNAPEVAADPPLSEWCLLDPEREPPLPVDDSDGGCACRPWCVTGQPWTRQISTLEIRPGDAITDSAEAYYLMRQRGITCVILMGVHTNMCVLGRPFAIRQMVYQGMDVLLMRDLTDAMYNPRRKPYVGRFRGTELVVEHIERYWCPTITSDQVIGGKPFRFRGDRRSSSQAGEAPPAGPA